MRTENRVKNGFSFSGNNQNELKNIQTQSIIICLYFIFYFIFTL